MITSNFRYQHFVAVSGYLGGKVPVVDDVLSSHEQKIYPTTSLECNCIEFEFQTDWNYYVDLRQADLALKMKLVRGRGYETYNSKETKKSTKKWQKRMRKRRPRRSQRHHFLVTNVNNICTQFFPMLKCTSTISKFKTPMDCMRTNLTFPTILTEPSLNTRVLHYQGYEFEEFPDEIMEAPLSEEFFARRMKMLRRPVGFMLYRKLGVDFFSTSEFLYPKMKMRLRLIRARPNFNIISNNPNVSLGIVDCSLYTRLIDLKDDYHKKRMDMLAYFPVDFNYLETLAKTFIIPARQNQLIEENIRNNAPVRRTAFAKNTNSAFTGSYTSILVSTFWSQKN